MVGERGFEPPTPWSRTASGKISKPAKKSWGKRGVESEHHSLGRLLGLQPNNMTAKKYRVHVYDDFYLLGTILVEEANRNTAIAAAKKRVRFNAVPPDCVCGGCSYSKPTGDQGCSFNSKPRKRKNRGLHKVSVLGEKLQ